MDLAQIKNIGMGGALVLVLGIIYQLIIYLQKLIPKKNGEQKSHWNSDLLEKKMNEVIENTERYHEIHMEYDQYYKDVVQKLEVYMKETEGIFKRLNESLDKIGTQIGKNTEMSMQECSAMENLKNTLQNFINLLPSMLK